MPDVGCRVYLAGAGGVTESRADAVVGLDDVWGGVGGCRVGRRSVERGSVRVLVRIRLEDRPLDVRRQKIEIVYGVVVEAQAVDVEDEAFLVFHIDRENTPIEL